MSELELTSVVGGSETAGGAEVADVSPAEPGQIVAHVRLADAAVAQAAVDAAREASDKWRGTPAPERGAILHRAAALVAAEHIARGAFLSAGQKCTATSRLGVDEAVLEEFTGAPRRTRRRLARRRPAGPGNARRPARVRAPVAHGGG
jgi:acyl-CoA reductase-like NAD-dependent aldehyde dehydrogenase